MTPFRLPFSSDRARKDAREELRLHIEGRIDELVAQGMPRDQAEAEAIRKFGDPGRIESEVTDIDVATNRRRALRETLGSFTRDIRIAARSLTRRRTYAAAVILTLALGMGAATTIYTVLQRVVIDPLPYPAADRLVRFMNPIGKSGKTEWDGGYTQYYHYAKAAGVEKMGLYDVDAVNAASALGAESWRGNVARVTASVFDLLGARTLKGRVFTAEEDIPNGPSVVVLSANIWRTRFGGDEGIVGKSIQINERPYEVVGVLEPGVGLPPEPGSVYGSTRDLWVPRRLNPAGPFYSNHTHPLIGRIREGATLAQVQAQIEQLVMTLPEMYPNAYQANGVGPGKFTTRVYPMRDFILGDTARSIWIAFAAVLLVLAIACANVANLFLVRLETQRHEHGVRTALGAARRDITFEALAEGVVLAGGGAVIGSALAMAGFKWLTWLAPAGFPRLEGISFGWQAATFVLVVSVIVACAFGLTAAMHYRGRVVALGDGGRNASVGRQRQRVRGALVAAQVALALVLVIGAGLLFRSFGQLRGVSPGVDPRGVMTVEWFLPYQRYDSTYKAWNFDRAVLEKVRAIPGVESAGAADILPLYNGFGCTVQGFEDQAVFDRLRAGKLDTCAGQGTATPGFFETLRAKLVEGRFFTNDDNDDPSHGAVIVTKAAAERWWPGENPLGKGINPNGWNKPPFYHVVGVIDDIRGRTLEGAPAIGVYYPVVPQMGRFWDVNYMRLAVRVQGDPVALFEQVRRAVHEVDPAIPLANAEPMELALDRATARVSFIMLLIGVAGAVALILAAVGLYGVISYLVVRRTGEIGVRLALGAQPSQVEGLVVGGALRMAAIGIAIGLVGAFAASRVLQGLLFQVKASDPLAYGIATAVLIVVAALAGWIPARRAAKLSPIEALSK